LERAGRRLFGTSGIRGPYPSVVNPNLAYRIGLALARLLGGKGIVNVGYDVRSTSTLLALSLSAGLMAGGISVRALGLVPTPVLAYSVREYRASAGAMITASHNPPGDNGIKLFDEMGMEFVRSLEEKVEELFYDVESPKEWSSVGEYEVITDARSRYLADLVERLEGTREKVVLESTVIVDCANSVSSMYTPHVLRALGFKVITTNCNMDPHFTGRHPEPRQDVLEEFQPLLADLGAKMLLAHDGDADRLSVLTPKRGFVRQDYLIALFSLYKLREKRGVVIVSVDVGNSVKQVVEENGGRIVWARLGKIHEKLKEHPSAILAAEPWKLIDPGWGFWTDGIYQAALLAKIVIEEGRELDGLLDGIPPFYWSRGSIEIASNQEKEVLFEALKNELLAKYGDSARVLDIDGVRFDFDDNTWALVRPSGTESKLRFYIESPCKERLKELEETIVSYVKGIAWMLEVKLGKIVVNRGA